LSPAFRDINIATADADIVIILHRPDGDKSKAMIKLAKQRNGPTGTCMHKFNGAPQTFMEDRNGK